MKVQRAIFILVLIAVFLPGISWFYVVKFRPWHVAKMTRDFLRSSDQFILLSVQPKLSSYERNDEFRTARVLGQVTITDAKERDALIDSLLNDFAPPAHDAGCHYPRHAIRAIKGQHTMELTICFSCNNINFRNNGQRFWHQAMHSRAKGFYDQILRKYHVPLAQK